MYLCERDGDEPSLLLVVLQDIEVVNEVEEEDVDDEEDGEVLLVDDKD